MPTAQNVYDLALDIAKVDADSYRIPAFEEERVIDWINWIRDDWFTRTELFRRHTVYKTAAKTAVSSAYTAGDTTLSLDSVTGFNGAFYMGSGTNTERGEHTGTSGSDLTGVSNLNLDHAIDVSVLPMLQLPDLINIHYLEVDGIETDPKEYRIENKRFLDLDRANATVVLKYSYLPDAITSISDDIKIDNPYHYFLVYGLIKIWKEVEEATTDTGLEDARMNAIANQAISKHLQAKKLNITTFNRYKTKYITS